jgi:hypothetical protein
MLESLTAEADLKAWTLFLDTSNEALVRYYEQFGFMPASAPVLLPCGERSVRMLRRPSGATVGNLG